jgi:hypothetical protein
VTDFPTIRQMLDGLRDGTLRMVYFRPEVVEAAWAEYEHACRLRADLDTARASLEKMVRDEQERYAESACPCGGTWPDGPAQCLVCGGTGRIKVT